METILKPHSSTSWNVITIRLDGRGSRQMINMLRGFGRLALVTALIAGAPAIADAGWRQDMGTFRIGLLADPGTDRNVAGLADIRRAYELALGMPVSVFVAKDYAALIDAHATSRIDYAIYSATAYATAQRLCSCVEPIAARQGPGRDLGVRAVLVMRKSALNQSGRCGRHQDRRRSGG